MRSVFRKSIPRGPREGNCQPSAPARTHAAVATAGIVCSLLLLTAGCSGVKAVPVSGTVTVDGAPVENVALNFTPISAEGAEGPGSSGVTDAQGRYSLRTIGDRRARGAVVGKHRVILSESLSLAPNSDPYDPKITPEEAEARLRKISSSYKLPPSARDGSITFEVPPGGTSEADFAY